MEFVNTPGSRLRYFASICFRQMGDFTSGLGYKGSGTVYDYFNDKKPLGPSLLRRFHKIGGNPKWVISGKGCIFADNDIGKRRQREFAALLQLPAEPNSSPSSDAVSYSEHLYLLLSLATYRLTVAHNMTPASLPVFREMLLHAQREIDIRA